MFLYKQQQPYTNMMTGLLKKVCYTLVFSVWFFLPMIANAQTPANKALEKLVKKADQAYSLDKFVEASNLYQQVLAADPNHYHSTYRMGLISNKIKDFREAQRWFRKAIETDPERNDTAYLELGLVYKKLNNYMKAKESFLLFQKKHPNQEDEYFMRAENEIKGCDFAEAEAGKKPAYRVDTVSFNSAQIDQFPAFLDQRQEDRYMVFTSHRVNLKNKNNNLYQGLAEEAFSDLYMVVMENDSTFGADIMNIGSPVNTAMNDGGSTFTGDGLTMYYTICNQGKNKGYECSVYETRYDYASKQWGKPVAIKGINGTKNIVINSKGKTKTVPCYDTQAAVSADGMTMVFVSDRDGGKGGLDIWVSHRTGDGWTAPENAGDAINTAFNDISPTLNEDGSILFFASEGHVGYGGYDLYKAELKDGLYVNPVNVGAPINTSYDDYGSLWMHQDSAVYFTSNRPGGKGRDDIYRATYIVYPYPQITAAVQGVIRDKVSKQPVPFATAVLFELQDDGTAIELNKMNTDQKARYNFPLEIGKRYKIVGNAPDYLSNEVTISTVGIDADYNVRGGEDKHFDLERNIDIEIEPITISKPIVLQNIFYDYDKYFIRPDAAAELDKLVDIMKKNPQITIELGSHTDTNGSEPYNKALSDKRAMSAVKYLADKGIAPERLTWFGYGESKPIFAPERNDEEEQQNRRTEFRITSIDFVPKAIVTPTTPSGTMVTPNGVIIK